MSPATQIAALPRAAEPFVRFATLLRINGFAAAPEQTQAFIAGVGLLGPRDMQDVRRAAHATFGPPPERHEDFDALFDLHFLEQGVLEDAFESDTETEDVPVQEADVFGFEPPQTDEDRESGQEAARAEALTERAFSALDEAEVLRRFRRRAKRALPQRRVRRLVTSKRGATIDLRRAMRHAIRNDGEIVSLPVLRRKLRQRRVLLLIDVSGSMKDQTDSYLRFAHALKQSADQAEVFTFGTRLTRITRALAIKNRDRALDAAAAVVSDWDGGTRIGDALQAFLAVPRFAGFARGALVLVLSDGLERGETDAMTDAVTRLSRRAWRLAWLNPLATGDDYAPTTAGLRAVAPFLDDLVDASRLDLICDHVLSLAGGRVA